MAYGNGKHEKLQLVKHSRRALNRATLKESPTRNDLIKARETKSDGSACLVIRESLLFFLQSMTERVP
jgi:hypothetical protein